MLFMTVPTAGSHPELLDALIRCLTGDGYDVGPRLGGLGNLAFQYFKPLPLLLKPWPTKPVGAGRAPGYQQKQQCR